VGIADSTTASAIGIATRGEEEWSLMTATALATGSVAFMAEHVSARATVRSRSMLILLLEIVGNFSEKRKRKFKIKK
jgi:hypothetical protein